MDRQHEHIEGATQTLWWGLVCSNQEVHRLWRDMVGKEVHTSILDQPLKESRALHHTWETSYATECETYCSTYFFTRSNWPGAVEGREGNTTAKVWIYLQVYGQMIPTNIPLYSAHPLKTHRDGKDLHDPHLSPGHTLVSSCHTLVNN